MVIISDWIERGHLDIDRQIQTSLSLTYYVSLDKSLDRSEYSTDKAISKGSMAVHAHRDRLWKRQVSPQILRTQVSVPTRL